MSMRLGWESVFIASYISERDNNKNNWLDLNGTKENIHILFLYSVSCDSWTATEAPEEAPRFAVRAFHVVLSV